MKRLVLTLTFILSTLPGCDAIVELAWASCGVATTPRGDAARVAFAKKTGYPHGRKGYVIDHIVPLCRGGKDVVENLQWQEYKLSLKKDKLECNCKVTVATMLQKFPPVWPSSPK